jgi:hypothetical protein
MKPRARDKTLRQNKTFINQFGSNLNKLGANNFIKKLKKGQLRCVCEIVLNLCAGNIPVSDEAIEQFRPHAKLLKHLTKKSVSLKNKKQVLGQHGSGIIAVLAATVLPLVVEFLSKKIF